MLALVMFSGEIADAKVVQLVLRKERRRKPSANLRRPANFKWFTDLCEISRLYLHPLTPPIFYYSRLV